MIMDSQMMASMADLGLLSPDGKCYSFDHRANGYSRGEGVGVVIIKRLDDALRDGDTIRAIIRATGSNQDGKTPVITQPNGDAQERLIRDTYRTAALDLKTTRYFEAHGTGTRIGDPTEARAIAAAFKGQRSPDAPLYIGAVKTNIGHLEGASGIAGLIKAILVLESGLIPPNLWYEKVNPEIPEATWNIRVYLHSEFYYSILTCISFRPRKLNGRQMDSAGHQSTRSVSEDRTFMLYWTMFTII